MRPAGQGTATGLDEKKKNNCGEVRGSQTRIQLEKEVIGYKDPSNEVCVWGAVFKAVEGGAFIFPA